MIDIHNYAYNSFENMCVKVHIILYNKIVIVISPHNNKG